MIKKNKGRHVINSSFRINRPLLIKEASRKRKEMFELSLPYI